MARSSSFTKIGEAEIWLSAQYFESANQSYDLSSMGRVDKYTPKHGETKTTDGPVDKPAASVSVQHHLENLGIGSRRSARGRYLCSRQGTSSAQNRHPPRIFFLSESIVSLAFGEPRRRLGGGL